MKISKAVDATLTYLEKQMTPGMSDFQEVLFYTFAETVREETDTLVETMSKSPFVRALLAVDKDGNVDTDKLISRIKKGMDRRGGFSVDVPLYGPVRFLPEDIDNIANLLTEEDEHENYQGFGRVN